MTDAVAATLQRHEAREPPAARGLARDEVRMLVATGDGLSHARARDLPAHLRAADLLVVNTSATLPAALPVTRADGSALALHLSTPDGPRRWVVELRRDGERFAGGRAGAMLALPGEATATLLAPYLAGARLWLAELDTGDVAQGEAAGQVGVRDRPAVRAELRRRLDRPGLGRPPQP